MRSRAVLLLASLAASCAPAAPAAVRPTLEQVEALGYDCADGIPDNVPSGLTEWACVRTVAGHRAWVGVDGNAAGIVEITLAIDSTDVATSRAEFQRLVGGIARLAATPGLDAALAGWSGAQDPKRVGGVGVNGECDVTQCIVYIALVEGPTQPPQ